jgi:signal transduction histidine kinase
VAATLQFSTPTHAGPTTDQPHHATGQSGCAEPACAPPLPGLLHRSGLLDTPQGPPFDRLTRLAARLLDVPAALIALTTIDRVCLKAAIGVPEHLLGAHECSLVPALCRRLVESGQPLPIPDTRTDPLTSSSADLAELGIVTLLAVPLTTAPRTMLGTLYVVDVVPRDWSPRDLDLLADLAAVTVTEIELRARIAERQETETMLQRCEQQLRQAQKTEAVELLAGGLAHEFNNLLTVITCHGDLLLDALGPSHPSHPDAKEIRMAADRATTLTRQLLAFSRKQLLRPRVLDLNTVLVEVEPMLRRLIGEDVRMTCIPAARHGRVNADRGQLEQVLLNLALNARDAMPSGGSLTIETADVSLEEPLVHLHGVIQPAPYAVLRVRDTGCGMDAATQARVFEPFFTTKPRSQATGLGLSTTYGIVRQNDGHIAFESEQGAGTTFTVWLPRVPGPEPETDTGPDPATASSATVLLVEDDTMVRRLARRLLEHHGFTVLDAEDGPAALRLAAHHPGPIHLLLSDVVMPEMGGRELARALRAARPGIKVLYMSGYSDDLIARRGALNPRLVFLQKPFAGDELVRAVRHLLAT